MPKVRDIDGISFSFYSWEGNEPAHIHIRKGGAVAKYWLRPMQLVYSRGFNPNEQRKIKKLLREHADAIATEFDIRTQPAS